jgi:hypothetical protein
MLGIIHKKGKLLHLLQQPELQTQQELMMLLKHMRVAIAKGLPI